MPRYRPIPLALALAATALLTLTGARTDTPSVLLGGQGSVERRDDNAFSMPASNLDEKHRANFLTGVSLFRKTWSDSTAASNPRPGLGPFFNARSCVACHPSDGRGAPPGAFGQAQEPPLALLMRLSIPAPHGTQPEPVYGNQFTTEAVAGVASKGRIEIDYRVIPGRYGDGTLYQLQQPGYRLTALGYGPLHPKTQLSPRIAPQMIGLGLLEAVRAEDIVANAHRQRGDADGIAGQVNRVDDVERGTAAIGRFGWKANVASLPQQLFNAFNADLGVTSDALPREDCPPGLTACRPHPTELTQGQFEPLLVYSRLLAVPSQRDADTAQVRRGSQLFTAARCAVCHQPRYHTGELAGFPELRGQEIRPYTDLLLHDMGEGLADHRPDGLANGRQWKTPPLWGIGLIPTVNGHSRYLHDGRARNLAEAVLWHDGEARASRERFRTMNAADRAALLAFLGSL
ncbi:c-type cytochrome [Neisseriaceae bacterium JH1-16]|nr:c-type cytochrome [Neisseriaceae bacterium JH1-16]